MMLSDYRTLGNSGLIVSPLALGTMTFGTARWGSDEGISKSLFDAYVAIIRHPAVVRLAAVRSKPHEGFL